MRWVAEYYEQADTTQPAEEFETSLFLGRELFGFDGEQNRVILLHGYVKRVGEPASIPDLEQACGYWKDYQRTHKISPEVPEQERQA